MTIHDMPTLPGTEESSDPILPAEGPVRSPLARWSSRRKWPIVLTVVFVVTGMMFMFFWNAVVHHQESWATGGDLWGIFQAAHYVGWGSLGGVYTPGNGVVAFPGMPVLLAPVAMVTGHFNMTEPWGPFTIPRPTAALVLMPIELLLGATVIFAADALAEHLEVSSRRRIGLCVAVAVIAWPVVAAWGHAEDALALTFALYAMIAMLNGKWATMGWLFGLGIVFQPLVALMLPLFLGATPQGKRIMLAVRSSALSAVLVGVAFLGNASDTYTAVVKQPTPPGINHATPWVALAPELVKSATKIVHYAALSGAHGHATVAARTAKAQAVIVVSGGAGRIIDIVLAVLVGLFVWRRPQPTVRLLWLAAAVLASRCFFEPVMTPYYLAPPLILALILVSRQRGKRFWAATILSLEVTVFAYHHLNEWVWWLTVVAGLIGVLALGYPDDLVASSEEPASSEVDQIPVDDVVDLMGSDTFDEVRHHRQPALR
jgi:hypothetical protein